jgi:hypothetical protein
MATYETDATTHILVYQTDGELLRAIEDALTRIQHEGLAFAKNAGSQLARHASKRSPGPDGAETARNDRTQKAETLR